MVRVAILGGTGHVGKTLVEVIGQDPRYSVVVLGRTIPAEKKPGVEYVSINYNDVSSIASTLEENQIHTVISCLMLTEKPIADAESATIAAAERSPSTRRFIASNWGPPTLEEKRNDSPWFPYQLASRDQLRETSLEWTEVVTGYFLDYWGMPYIKTNLTPDLLAVDVVHGVAGIPGTGNEPIAFAYSYDVARVVAEVVSVGEWDEHTYIVGDKLTWNEFVALAESARGRQFNISYDDVNKLANGDITELPNHKDNYHQFPREELRAMYASIGLSMARGAFDLDLSQSVHLRHPDLKMLTVKAMLQNIWRSRQEGPE
ncbi:hypothetical protein NLU13_7861 [Sarocladium strictum]|uniref:NmrA-like domain-containing protein n=1 Tax=Sarocladium strictum TaxID=5046 RepID=A0AA39L650_SARSR|nr:hypothetical protein NLU13_7861 [Sarocladium strictum]